MKKLKLDQQKFAGAEVLSRAQLRKVMGGNGSGPGNCTWTDDNPTKNCAKNTDGSDNCKAQCYVTCDDSCGNSGKACLSNWTCGVW